MKLPRTYFQSDDVVFLARDLIGKVLYSNIGGRLTAGIITETEAYAGVTDRASHAYNGRRTKRTEVMYLKGGVTYVYLCYGMHNLLNFVTGGAGTPHAVLIRGIYPTAGIPEIRKRRKNNKISVELLANGPGKVSNALGITTAHNALPLDGPLIWVEANSMPIGETTILAGPRIGIDYAGEDAHLPYRFLLDIKKALQTNEALF